MPRITPQREEATRRRILEAARQVFIQKGFNRASIDDVVAASGMSVGAIYGYFPNKDELIRAAIDASNREQTTAIAAEMQAASGAAERMERGIAGWWASTFDVPGGPAFLAEAWGEASRRPAIRELMAVRYERAVTVSSMFLQQSIASGELPPGLDVDRAARTFATLLDGLVLEYVISGGTLRKADALASARLVLQAAVAGASEAGR